MYLIHQLAPSCWYHIIYIPNSSRNVSSYLGLDSKTHNNALLNTGFGKKMKRAISLTIGLDDWKRFHILHELPNQHELSVEADRKRRKIRGSSLVGG